METESMLDVYTDSYVKTQLSKFKNRYSNHWKNHIHLAKNMVSEYAATPPASLLDLGC